MAVSYYKISLSEVFKQYLFLRKYIAIIMFNRILLIVLCTLSLGWIFYVGYDVFYKTDRLSPELVFTKSDKELLIINRTDEYFETEIPFEIPTQIQELAHKFIETPRNERIFISKARPVLLIESPHYWNKHSVIVYLQRKGISYSEENKELRIGNYKLQFKYHFLLVAPLDFERLNEELILPQWDKKATAVIVHTLSQRPYLTEIYKQDNGQIVYQTTFENKVKSQKVDDKNVFAAYLPASISSYHFYETNYALDKHVLSASSAMNDWLNYGFVLFSYNGNTALMTDMKLGEDPINTFNMKFAKDTVLYAENKLIKHIKLLETFPLNSSNGFYLTRVGDKVVFSENLDLNKKILADYELGSTLLLDSKKTNHVFGNLPAKVSERVVSNTDVFAISMYGNISTKYLVQASQKEEVNNEPQTTDNTVQHYIVTINGTIAQSYGKGNQQYFVTSNNQLFAINNGKTIWNLTVDGSIIGKIKFVDYDGTGKNYLLFNTDKKLYVLNESGVNMLDGKVLPKGSFLNEVNFYRWKNQSNIIYSDEVGKIKNYTVEKNSTKTILVKAGSTQRAIEAFVQNNRLVGIYLGDRGTQTIDLDKYKALKVHPVIPSDALLYKEGGQPYVVYYQKGELMRLDYTSKKTSVGMFNEIQKLRLNAIGQRTFVTLISSNKLYIYDDKGGLFKQIAIPISDVVDYDIVLVNGQLFIAFLDGLENKVVVCDANGNILRRDIEGKGSVFISAKGTQLNIMSEGNGYAVQYYDVLKK